MRYRGLIIGFAAVAVAFVFGMVPSLLGSGGTMVVMFLAVAAAFVGAIRYHLDYRHYLSRWRRDERG